MARWIDAVRALLSQCHPVPPRMCRFPVSRICRWLDWLNFLTSLRLQLRFFDTAAPSLFAKVNYFIVSQVNPQAQKRCL